MWTTAKEMLTSKKFLAAIVAVIVWIAAKAGFSLDSGELLGAVTPLWAYIIGQGIADHGKSKAQIEAPKEAA
jgi:hypothetical protein